MASENDRDAHRDVYTVESICDVLPIAPSTYVLHEQGRPSRPAARLAATTTCVPK